jgi:hypothetical protein
MRPNLFIVGAPKCGTSSLFDWLTNHPGIKGSRIKEPFFLTDPVHPLSRRPNLADDGMAGYEMLFAPGDADAPIRIEATTHYLFDPMARDAISDMPDARVIIVLREPAARVYSSFKYTANNLARTSPNLTFARYVALVEGRERLSPRWCSHTGSAFVLERDIEYSHYAKYVKQWIEAVGHNRIKILLMENMINDPDSTVRSVLSWLDLEPDRLTQLDQEGRNRTEEVRIPGLQAMARKLNSKLRPPDPIRRLAKRAYSAFQFRKPTPLATDDAAALRRLQVGFASDNAELAEITGLDLSVWSKGPIRRQASEQQ